MAALRHVRRLPGGVRRPGRPPLPRPADRLPGLRPAAPGSSTRHGRADRGRRPARRASPRPCAAGKIGALKGLGGYHLACDARDDGGRRGAAAPQAPRREAVRGHGARTLGRRGGLCEVGAGRARRCCTSPRRPIVLLRKRPAGAVAEAVAPGNPWLGVMLPYTPLHHLLLRAVGGVPLVMTSGNRSDEPIAYRRRRRAGTAGRHRRPVPDPRPADPRPLRRLGDAGRRRGRAAGPAVARLRPAADRAAGRLPAADPGGRRPAQGDVRPRPRPAGVPQPPPGRPRPLRGVPGVREGRRPLRAALRRPARAASPTTCTPTTPRPRYARRARGAGGHRDCSPCSTIMRTWRAAWPRTAWTSRSSA